MKHRTKLIISASIFWVMLALHLACAMFTLSYGNRFGWLIVGFCVFELFLLLDGNLAQNAKLLWILQVILLLQSAYALSIIPHLPAERRTITETISIDQRGRPVSREEYEYLSRKKAALVKEKRDRSLREGDYPQEEPDNEPSLSAGEYDINLAGFGLDIVKVSEEQVKQAYPLYTQELAGGFLPDYRNPCWNSSRSDTLLCIPYAYILGMPKCGTTDLYERITEHPDVQAADKKEVRFFTPGEFETAPPSVEYLGPKLSARAFAKHHIQAAVKIKDSPDSIIVDGGPHTLWWSIQQPGGAIPPTKIPIPHLLHTFQPQARLIVTLAEPVRRMYSDYYFLNEDSVAASPAGKNPALFDQLARSQSEGMRTCFRKHDPSASIHATNFKLSLKAEQMCAYDRYQFARPGTGRIAIGMYHAFLANWFTVYPESSFLVLRLEDFSKDREAYLRSVYSFLGLSVDNLDWKSILFEGAYNVHVSKRDPILPQTQVVLREFYEPFNKRLAELLHDDRFLWNDVVSFKDWPQPADDVSATPPMKRFSVRDREQLLTARVDKKEESCALCYAAFALHKVALQQMLENPSLAINERDEGNLNRVALHCIGMTFVYGDSLRTSFLFNLLKDQKGWLDEFVHIQRGLGTYAMRDVTDGIQDVVTEIGRMLIEAGQDVDAIDDVGMTPLHYAAMGGFPGLARALLEAGARTDVQDDKHGHTPLHVAAIVGHADVAKLLVEAGSDAMVQDNHGNTARDIAEGAGSPILAEDFLDIFNFEKPEAKQLDPPSESPHGDGEWSTVDLDPTAEYGDGCDADMYHISEITPEEVRQKYLYQNRPVLLRGVLDGNPGWKAYTKSAILQKFGRRSVTISDIPYSDKYGSGNDTTNTVNNYVSNMGKGVHGSESSPWYLFKANKVPADSNAVQSFVSPELMSIPQYMYEIFNPETPPETTEEERRSAFENMQFALGQRGSGAPVHFHNTAWSALFYGKKHWYIYPPSHNLMGKRQVLEWVRNELEPLKARGFTPMQCVQHAGDVIIIPESWGHGVLNVRESVAVASEAKQGLFRLKTIPPAFGDLMDKNKKKRKPRY